MQRLSVMPVQHLESLENVYSLMLSEVIADEHKLLMTRYMPGRRWGQCKGIYPPNAP